MVDQYYQDAAGAVHFLTAQDQVNAGALKLPFPNPAWTAISEAQAMAVLNPPLSLAKAQAAQVIAIQASCESLIIAGQTSAALGSLYTYPSGLTDQANLNANVVSSLLPGLLAGWTTPQLCLNSVGVWAYLPHSVAEIQQVGSDVKAAIMALLLKSANYQAEIALATTVAEVQAIVWV